jgi:hypothetical protein
LAGLTPAGNITRVPEFLEGGELVNHGFGAHDLLLVLLLVGAALLGLSSLGLLSAHTTGTSTAEGRGKGEVDVLLGVKTDNERGNVDDLLADAEKRVSNVCDEKPAILGTYRM